MDRQHSPEIPAAPVDEASIYLERAIARSECEVTRRFLQRILGTIKQVPATSAVRSVGPPGTEP